MQKKFHMICCVLLFVFICCNYAYASTTIQPREIKVALLDTPYNEMPLDLSLLTEYQNAYLAGAKTAVNASKKYNLDISYKPFFYGNDPLDILSEVPKIKQWHADFVIGPSSSDQLLLLRNYLPNTIVLSSYASDKTLKMLPKNFYSIFLTDNQIMRLLAGYIHKKYPHQNVYIIEQADCKQCVDVGALFIEDYKKLPLQTNVSEKKIIMSNIASINAKKLMNGHENDVTLVFNTTYYAYNTFIKHIATSYPNKKLIFFSDQDNWGNAINYNLKTKNDLPYESYRIGPLLLDSALPDYKNFSKAYYNAYHAQPKASVSYMTYITIMSVVEALNKYQPISYISSMHTQILQSYLTALSKNPHWYKIDEFAIYHLTSKGEVLVARLPKPQSNF